MKTRHDELEDCARKYHEKNPQVWSLFHRFTMEKIKQGFKSYGAQTIFEKIRWETDQAKAGPDTFKVNNNHMPFYARWWMEVHPRYGDFFHTRAQISEKAPALGLPELGPEDYE